jgi:hypothetical protein
LAAAGERFPWLQAGAVFLRWATQPADVYAVFPFGSGGSGGVGVQIDPDLEYLILWDGHARAEFGDWDGDQVPPALEFMAGLLVIRHREVAVCGLSCRLCPHYHTAGASRCTGCKGESRMSAGCAFLTCAVKRRGIESCGDCGDKSSCERWASHRAAGREHDSFVTYAVLEDNIAFIERHGIEAFDADQRRREDLLREMLAEFNEGRSKTYYCVAATLLDVEELSAALREARLETAGEADMKARQKVLRARLDAAASARSIRLALRP